MKQFLEQQMTDAVQEEFLQEVRIMKDLRHPNIVQFMGATWKPRGIVMQYMHRGSLFRLLHRNNKARCPRSGPLHSPCLCRYRYSGSSRISKENTETQSEVRVSLPNLHWPAIVYTFLNILSSECGTVLLLGIVVTPGSS